MVYSGEEAEQGLNVLGKRSIDVIPAFKRKDLGLLSCMLALLRRRYVQTSVIDTSLERSDRHVWLKLLRGNESSFDVITSLSYVGYAKACNENTGVIMPVPSMIADNCCI